MGIELELLVLLIMAVVGQSTFARFGIEVPAWQKVLKWFVLIGVTLALCSVGGHWSLLFPIGVAIVGTTVHFRWCRKNGIHPTRATPSRRYYELRGWPWPKENA